MNDRLARVLAAQESIKKGDYRYPDDDIVIIPAGGNPGAGAGGDGVLIAMDPNISELMSTARPEKLLKNDGTIATQVVKSVAVAEPGMAKANRAFDTGTKVFNFKSFLSANAMRSTNSLDGLMIAPATIHHLRRAVDQSPGSWSPPWAPITSSAIRDHLRQVRQQG
jgi:hypothetical protein